MRYRITLDVTCEVSQATADIALKCSDALDTCASPEVADFIRQEVRENIIAYMKAAMMHPDALTIEEHSMIIDPGCSIWTEVLMHYWEATDVDQNDQIPYTVREQVALSINSCLENMVARIYALYGIRLQQSNLGIAPQWLGAPIGHDTSILLIVVEQ